MINKYQILTFFLLLIVTLNITPHHKKSNSNAGSTSQSHQETAGQLSAANHQALNPASKHQSATSQHTTSRAQSTSHKQSAAAGEGSKVSASPVSSTSEEGPADSDPQTAAGLMTANEGKTTVVSPRGAPHSFTTILVTYTVIIVLMIVTAKFAYYPRSNVFEALLDFAIFVDTSIKKLKNREVKTGYAPPQNVEEVDDSNSITVGYNEEHGKQLFWERNSVEGI